MKKSFVRVILVLSLTAVFTAAPAQAQTVMEWMTLSVMAAHSSVPTTEQCKEPDLFEIMFGQTASNSGGCFNHSVFGFEPQPIAAAP